MSARLASALAALLVACGGAQSPAEPDLAMAPTPFTAEQIRDACPTGRVAVWQMTSPDGTRRVRSWFEGSNSEGTTFRSVPLDDADQPLGEPDGGTATWEELRLHASYPAEHTVVTDATLEVPAGTFETKLYTVTDPDAGTVTRAWFATSLPGPPVRMVVERGGEPVQEMVLESVRMP